MGGVVVIALLTLLVVRVAPAGARCLREMRASHARDRPAELLRLAIRSLPADRAEWGRAMLGELDAAPGSRARWRFSLGCAKAAAAWRVRERLGGGHRDGAAARAVILAAVAASLALGAYGPVRYRLPGASWAAVLTLVAVLLAYVLCALGLSRGMAPRAVVARRHGLIGGLAVGGAWLVVLFPTAPLKEWVAVPLAVAMLAPASVAALTARATWDARAATAAALWCGLAGGLVVFVISVTAAYLQAGGPYDPQLIRDFQASGAPDLTAYAVSDNLGEALAMLMIVPTVALAAGSLAVRIGSRRAQPAGD